MTGISQHATLDVATQFADGVAQTASGATEVAASAVILDVGDAAMRADLMMMVTALVITANDEGYDIVLQGSPDADFATAANVVELAAIHLGAKEVKRTDSDQDDVPGTYLMPVNTRRDGTVYRYLRLYVVVVGGGSPSITMEAWLAKERP